VTEILDLSTVVERDTVRIRTKKNKPGKLYDLVNLDELGPFEHQTIIAKHAKVAKFASLSRKLTAAEKGQLNKALGDILKLLVLDLEPAVLAEMEDTQRARIVTTWALKHGAAEGEEPAGPSTTGGSARASKRSTAATRKRGSTRRAGR
jgi:hypothetical protein